MNYRHFQAADFAADQFFIQWVLNPNPDHRKFWEAWMKNNPDKEELIQEAREMVLSLAQDVDGAQDWELDAIWENIQEARKEYVEQEHPQLAWWKEGPFKHALRVAAAILLLLIGYFGWYQYKNSSTIEYATLYGEKRTIQLPDHSIVILNANSKIKIPSRWSSETARKVILEGEAYFSVTHQKNDQKFLVLTSDGVQVEVLGTEFNVSDRGNVNSVVLAEGKVRLHIKKGQTSQQLEMEPGEKVDISEISREIHREEVSTDLYTAWKDNHFYVENTSLKEIALMLEQNYGYPVVFQEKELADLRVTASLQEVQLEDLLLTLSETLGIQITRENNRIFIRSKK